MNMIDGTTCLMEVEQLIREYTQMLGRDLSFQKLEEELRDLLRKYSGTEGRLLAAVADDGCVSGCVAYHRLRKECCEMKRLYVKPSYQGQGIGQKLVETLLLLAKDDGYSCMGIRSSPYKVPSGCIKASAFRKRSRTMTIRWRM